MEQLAQTLDNLYRSYGYMPYTMSKFEEYELYLRNKDFLVSDRILTFTDTDGKLMALKPDVTLSIIKNTNDAPGGIQKVYYRENVYRPGKSDQGFREIMQVGLECMGAVDSYCILEVMLLAVKSLRTISRQCVLNVSHMGLLSWLLDKSGLTGEVRSCVLESISSKNAHEIRRLCETADAPWQELVQIATLSGSAAEVMPALEKIFTGAEELGQFKQLLSALEASGADCINVDFSVINDMNYYNGIVFRGFIQGVPAGVLSGGQYDGMMAKMKRSGKAIGFALYPDLLERLTVPTRTYDVDAVLVYDETAELTAVAAAVESLTQKGMRVSAQPGSRGDIRAARCYRLEGNEVKCVETNA